MAAGSVDKRKDPSVERRTKYRRSAPERDIVNIYIDCTIIGLIWVAWVRGPAKRGVDRQVEPRWLAEG